MIAVYGGDGEIRTLVQNGYKQASTSVGYYQSRFSQVNNRNLKLKPSI